MSNACLLGCTMSRPVIAVSSCLTGENVRFNGGHKHSPLVTGHLAEHFDIRTVCPEVYAGMGIPRPAIRLVKRENLIRAEYSSKNLDRGEDVTQQLSDASAHLADTLAGFDGFLLTQKSPSCGIGGVKLYNPNGNPDGSTRGLFAAALSARYPLVPMEDSGRMNDAVLRENFIQRVIIHHEWRELNASPLRSKALLDFHTRHKFTVMSHSVPAYKQLGQMLANLAERSLEDVAVEYFKALMKTLAIPATRKCHTNVLQHLQGYVKNFMVPKERQALTDAIEQYRLGHVPLVVPVTLLRCFAHTHASATPYLNQQSYLQPYPGKLGLRNEI